MAKITLSDVTTISGINANFQALEDELNQKVLYRDNPDGEPNTLESDVDVNGKNILNANDVYVDNELFLQGLPISDAIDAAAGGLVEAAEEAAASAASSANIATISANSAAASYDSFDDRYLGPKDTPPTLDNDGNPLLVGALYWDTTLSPGGTFPATNITFAPAGNISATLVQTAIEELDLEKAKLNGDAAVAFAASTVTANLTGNVTGNVTGATTGAHNGTVGATTPNTGAFTTLSTSGLATLDSSSTTGNASVTGTFTPSQTNGIVGTNTNNNANAGSVGEYITATGGGTALTTSTQTTIASTSLTAGDWDVEVVGQFTLGAGATMTAVGVGFSTTNNALSSFDRNFLHTGFSATNSFGALAYPSPVTRISLAGTTTVYCIGIAVFSGGTNTGTGFIRARRVR